MATVFRTASTYLKLALLFIVLGLLFFIIGFATTYWLDTQTWHRGLWEWGHHGSRSTYKHQTSSYDMAVQAMECLGLICFILAFFALLLYFVHDQSRRRDFVKGTAALILIGLIFAVIGFALAFSFNRDNHLYDHNKGWSAILACIGAGFYGLALLMLILQLIGC